MAYHEPKPMPTAWNPQHFFKDYSENTHVALQNVYRYTTDAVIQGFYPVGTDGKHPLRLAPLGTTQVFDAEHPAPQIQAPGTRNTRIEVWNMDCLYAAKQIIDAENVQPLVLNMASFANPGGGVNHGARAQEEDLFRRSNYMMSLNPIRFDTYPLHHREGAIYSGNVTVFRDGRDKGYPFIEQPFQVDFIAVAAEHLHYTTTHFTDEQRELMRHKVRVLFRVAHLMGNTHLVLSALGCGAFHNPPAEVAQIFREVLQEPEFANQFDHIIFAIIDDHNAHGAGNYLPFQQAFLPY